MKFVSMALVALSMFVASIANATVAPAAGNKVMVGCTLSSSTGATVYSVDNSIINGSGIDSLTVPTGVDVGAACATALNALSGVTCATGKTWVITGPTNLISSQSGYSLQQFVATCQ